MVVIGALAAFTQGFLYGACVLFALRVISRGTWGHREALMFMLIAALAATCGYIVQESRREHDRMEAAPPKPSEDR